MGEPLIPSLLTYGYAKGVAGRVLRQLPLEQGSLQSLAEGFGGQQAENPIVPGSAEIRVVRL